MFNLLAIETKRTWLLYRRYPVELLGGLLMMFLTFYALFLGASYLAGTDFQFGDRLDGLVLGYGLWTLVLFNLSSTAAVLQVEAQTGTLEQVSMSGYGLLRVVIARGIASLGISLALSAVLLVILLRLTDRSLSFPPAIVLPLLTVIGASLGVGLVLGAAALLFKRVHQLMRLFQFVLLALVVVPVERWVGPFRSLSVLVPIAPSAGQLRDLMVRGLPFDLGSYWLGVANAALFLTLGVVCFRSADRAARRRGLLGQY